MSPKRKAGDTAMIKQATKMVPMPPFLSWVGGAGVGYAFALCGTRWGG